MSREWKVTFDGGFWSDECPGAREIPIGKAFSWGENTVYIPAAYVCEQGLILDIFLEFDLEREKAFLEKWVHRLKEAEQSDRLRRQLERENPMQEDYNAEVTVNGSKLWHVRGSGIGWIPAELLPEGERIPQQAAKVLEHYGMGLHKVWGLRRECFEWAEKGIPEIKSMELTLRQRQKEFSGDVFAMPKVGENAVLYHPLTGKAHVLTVTEIQYERLSLPKQMQGSQPENAVFLSFNLEPNLPREKFRLQDVSENDLSRGKGNAASIGIIGGADGPTSIFYSTPDGPEVHHAVSAMHFEYPEEIQWEPVFREKIVEDISVILI